MLKSDDHCTVATFTRWLRHALNHLYDFAELRRSPLAELLAGNGAPNPAALQATLITAIETLLPPDGINPQSSAARLHRVLYHRYVEQFSQSEVADDLGVSERQLRRREVTALEALAGYLADSFQLHLSPTPPDDANEPAPSAQAGAESSSEQELAWLQQSFSLEPAQVAGLVQTALATVESLAAVLQVQLHSTGANDPTSVLVQVEPTRQALVIVLTAALRSASGGEVSLTMSTLPEAGSAIPAQCIVLTVQGRSALAAGGPAAGGPAESGLALARQLLALSDGRLEILAADGAGFSAQLSLPIRQQTAVLFIDDNADTLQLFQRYLDGTRYIFLGARDQEQAFQLIEQIMPKIIVSDVMMPGIDGWQMLGRLRTHPLTQASQS